ncbi:hypothetical protein WK90_15785 [Burkholderia cepacia]|nr:hypothetical protein WK83_14675 [Burkholderia cepacia]KVV61567.1 hypothetical protein WK84_31095 [Burkholderia cepacia]KVV63911.1 hypothetical protein WK85_31715 [Burkholderia cepacia]KVV73247.1 hypothetical protein WK86_33680 [Burkholderia cepacia]KVV91134.1 hypothetical protein WK89_36755 [Burkholderia cepacia]
MKAKLIKAVNIRSSLSTREDATKALHSTERPPDFVATFVQLPVVLPRLNVRAQRRNDGDEAEIERELSGFVAFVRLVHQQVQRPIRRFQTFEQCSSVRRVAGRAPGSFSLMSLSLAIQTNRGRRTP